MVQHITDPEEFEAMKQEVIAAIQAATLETAPHIVCVVGSHQNASMYGASCPAFLAKTADACMGAAFEGQMRFNMLTRAKEDLN